MTQNLQIFAIFQGFLLYKPHNNGYKRNYLPKCAAQKKSARQHTSDTGLKQYRRVKTSYWSESKMKFTNVDTSDTLSSPSPSKS